MLFVGIEIHRFMPYLRANSGRPTSHTLRWLSPLIRSMNRSSGPTRVGLSSRVANESLYYATDNLHNLELVIASVYPVWLMLLHPPSSVAKLPRPFCGLDSNICIDLFPPHRTRRSDLHTDSALLLLDCSHHAFTRRVEHLPGSCHRSSVGGQTVWPFCDHQPWHGRRIILRT